MTKRIVSLLLATVLLVSSLSVALPVRANAADMTSSQQFIDVLKKWEGFSAVPYKDNTQYSIGYGSFCAKLDDKETVDYYTNNPITEAQAEEMLKQQLKTYEDAVNTFAAKYKLSLQQHQFDALVSFTYNCGGSWTNEPTGYLNTAVREGNIGARLIYGLGLWSSSAGKYILAERRLKEANMFINGEYDVRPDSYNWVFLDGNGGTTSYKIFSYNADYYTPLNVEFKSIPTGRDANGNPFAYTFAGWYTSSGKKVDVLDSSLSQGQTLTAKWADPAGNIVTPPANTPSADGFPKSATVVNVTSNANARTGPGTNYDYAKDKTVDKGEKLTVVEEVTGGSYTAGGKTHTAWCKLDDGRYVAKYYVQYDDTEDSITGISVVTPPTVTSYYQPVVAPRLEGSVLLVSYKSGYSEALTVKKNMVSGFDGSKTGKQTLTVSYAGKTTTMTVSVLAEQAPKITAQPADGYAPKGSKGRVTVKATGEDLRYTWYHKNAKASSFVVAPTTGNTYATTMSTSTHGRYVYCVITDCNGNSVTTDTARVFMSGALAITAQPKDGYAPAGSKGKVTVKATGEDLTYTWYHKNAKASSFIVAATTGPTYATTMSSSTDGRYVYCVITDRHGNSVTTDTARVFMGSPIEITAQPKDGYAPKGSKGRVTVQATGNGLTYTWYHKNAKASSFIVADTSGPTYATTMSSSTDGRYVYCVITDRDGNSVTTDTARVFMGYPVKLTAQPADGYAPKGSKGRVTVQATGEGLTYKWYHKNAKASSFVEAPTTGSTYATTMSSSTDGRYVYCVVTDKFGNSVTTETARVFMGTPLAITAQPATGYAPKGSKAKTTVRATGEGLTYTWYHKNAKASTFIVAATSGSTYATTMSSTTNGRMVYCVVTDKYGNSVTSDMAVLIMR